MKKPLKINKLLNGNLARLRARAHMLSKFEARLHNLLPAPLQPHCRLLAIREDNTLVLAADTPAWAVRLRFHAPQLVKQLSSRQNVTRFTVRVCVRPLTPARAVPELPPIRRSAQGAAALQQAAYSISDPLLKTALLKLAGRHRHR